MESRKKKKQVTTSMVVTLTMTTRRSTRKSNDVYDFDTGVDKNKKESVVNLVGICVAANVCLALGFIGLTWVAVEAGNIRSILFLTCAIICGFIYQCPPFRLSYQGLGEPLCFAAFGPFATIAFYLVQGSARLGSDLVGRVSYLFHFVPSHI